MLPEIQNQELSEDDATKAITIVLQALKSEKEHQKAIFKADSLESKDLDTISTIPDLQNKLCKIVLPRVFSSYQASIEQMKALSIQSTLAVSVLSHGPLSTRDNKIVSNYFEALDRHGPGIFQQY